MLIKKGETIVNMTQVFSMRLSGAGGRTILFRGSDSLSAEMHFQDKKEAWAAFNKILEAAENQHVAIDLDWEGEE